MEIGVCWNFNRNILKISRERIKTIISYNYLMKIIFTRHSEQRIKKRKITKEDIREAINYPDLINKKHNKLYSRKKLERGNIEVCCEKIENIIKIITVYWV
ncbi:DUF4258 domain-containing protein [Candidatus Woesearchaeota archaeon]|nr:DUF4258 domain-containing protein [Candidatus Woesearchaeota archaeon]